MSFNTRPGAILRVLCVLCALIGQQTTHAQSAFEFRTGREIGFVAPALALHGVSLLIHVPNDALWQRYGAMDRSELPAFDRAASYNWSLDAHHASNIALAASMGISLACAIIGQPAKDKMMPVALVSESVLLTSGLTDVVKELVHRPRPYVFNPDAPLEERMKAEAFVSFWSGHTANTAAVTFTCASIIQQSDASKTTKTIGWIGAAVLPAVVGYLRIKAGRHFPTDVLTGYLVGAAVGIAVPYFHRAEKTAP